jgi:hypothetical protein
LISSVAVRRSHSGKYAPYVLLPIVSAVYDFNLMKLRGPYLSPPSGWRCPPDFYFSRESCVLVAFKARREHRFKMEGLRPRLVERAAFDCFLDLTGRVFGINGHGRQYYGYECGCR